MLKGNIHIEEIVLNVNFFNLKDLNKEKVIC